MNVTVFQAILDTLAADTTLTGYLGGAYIFRARNVAPSQIPSITIQTNNESGKNRPGAAITKHRDANPTVQVDIWISSASEEFPCTGEDADLIANRIDSILLDASSPVTGTGVWEKTTESQQYESDTQIWHSALRYSFQYSLFD
jgi:hypothetical protein